MIPLPACVEISHGYDFCRTLLTSDGVMVVGLSGLATAATVGRALRRATAGQGARAFCLYADKSVLAVSADCTESIKPEDAPAMSGALVVDVGMVDLMRDYARRMARLGIIRKVFTSRAKALEWASDQARLAVAQEQWEKARRPAP